MSEEYLEHQDRDIWLEKKAKSPIISSASVSQRCSLYRTSVTRAGGEIQGAVCAQVK